MFGIELYTFCCVVTPSYFIYFRSDLHDSGKLIVSGPNKKNDYFRIIPSNILMFLKYVKTKYTTYIIKHTN